MSATCPATEQLRRMLEDDLPPTEAGPVESHVASCITCQQSLEELSRDSYLMSVQSADRRDTEVSDFLQRVIESPPPFLDDSGGLDTETISAKAFKGPVPQPVIPGYEILNELGHGGMGIVFRARHVRLNRSVALKMLLLDGKASPEMLARFKVEAETVARLQHPNVVRIHSVGEHEGRPFFEMEFVGGGSLAATLDGTPRHPREAARLVEAIARGVEAVHRLGVIHRDLKPSNVLIADDGSPKLGDFGLAKDLTDDPGMTRTNTVLGSPSYMAPEQAEGGARGVGPSCDIYSLGAVFYEMLTGRPPFRGATVLETLRQVKTAEPVAPSRLVPGLSRDAETIVLKCLEKMPGRRYATSGELADDLRRFIDDRPILARPQTHLERSRRWARRHPVIASLGLVMSAVLVVATAVSLLVARQMAALAGRNELIATSEREAKQSAQTAFTKAEANRVEAEVERDRAERNLYAARIGQAESALRLHDALTARALLDQCIPKPGALDRRGWEWSYLNQWARPELRILGVGEGWESNVIAVSPDGRSLVVGCAAVFAKQVAQHPVVPTYIFDVKDGQIRNELRGNKSQVLAVAFRPDGKRFATAGNENTIKTWASDTGRALGILSGLAQSVRGLSWSPDGTRLAAVDNDGLVRIWDPDTGRETARFSHRAEHVSWSPDGTRIATADLENAVRIWTADDRQPSGPLLAFGGDRGISWSPDGRRLAGIAKNGRLTVGDTQSGEVVFTVKRGGELTSAAYSPDGSRLATGGTDGIIRLYDAGSGEERAALLTGNMVVSSLAFSPDSRRLFASGSGMGGVKVFDAQREPRGRGVTPWLDQLAALAFLGETERLAGIATSNGPGDLASINFSVGGMMHEGTLPVIRVVNWPRGDFAFSADGRRLAAPLLRDQGNVGVWDVALGRLEAIIRGSSTVVIAIAFSPDGKRIATAAIDRMRRTTMLSVRDIASGREILTLDLGPIRVFTLAFASDGRKLAAGGDHFGWDTPGWVTVRDAETGALAAALDIVAGVKHLAFHPTEELLAIAARQPSELHLWDFAADKLTTREGPLAVSCVAFTKDGRRLASLGYLGDVHIAEAHTLEPVLVLRSFGPPAGSGGWTPRLAWCADGSRLAAHRANFLNLWDAGRLLDPQPDPLPDDVAGWLRRSRSFARGGDDARALSDFERALAVPTDFPEPWITHGLAEGVEPPQAEMAFTRAFSARCDDPLRWMFCARELGRAGREHEAGIARAKAQSTAETRLSAAPDDEPAAWVLAEIFKDGLTALPDGNWTILAPTELTSASGAKLTRLPDGSIVASGENPDRDNLTLVARTGLDNITGLRLEVFPDPRFRVPDPSQHSEFGVLRLNELSAAIAPGDDRSSTRPIMFVESVATNVRADAPIAVPLRAFNGNPATRWDVYGQNGLRNAIAFATATPVIAPAGSTWIIRLDCQDKRWKEGALGRFRISVTSGPVTLFESALHKALTEPEWNGRTRLGVVYYLQEDWPAAARALRIAADSRQSTGNDLFLLAIALHHLNRHDEARRFLKNGVEWLKKPRNSGTLRTVVVEAIAQIEKISRVEAEARMFLDPIFPHDLFAR